MLVSCKECRSPIRDSVPLCPHCGRPSLFPNVNAAQRAEEQASLDERYDTACKLADSSGHWESLRAFEAAAERSQAVICRPFGEVQRLAFSDDELYVTYYVRQESRVPGGDAWEAVRSQADTLVFGDQNKKHIRFAALTLSETGPLSYGECSILLREEMIGHRASLFEENTVFFVRRLGRDEGIPLGYRAEWSHRGRLAVAKSVNLSGWHSMEPQQLLLEAGATTAEDRFVEAHIWGPITIRSVAKVTVQEWNFPPPSELAIELVASKLSQFGVDFVFPGL